METIRLDVVSLLEALEPTVGGSKKSVPGVLTPRADAIIDPSLEEVLR